MADFDPRPWTDTTQGKWYRTQDALRGAGNALNAPDADPTQVRNNLLAGGEPAAANTVQGWANTQADQERQAAKDAEDAKLRASVAEVGKLASAGTPEAYAAARQRAFQLGMLDQAGTLDTMHQKARTDLAGKVGSYAANVDEQTWNDRGLPLLKQYGVDPAGYEGEAGRVRAATEGGYGQPMFKAQAASDLQDTRNQGAMEVAKVRAGAAAGNPKAGATMALAQHIADTHPGISPDDALQAAANPRLWRVQSVDTGTGQPTYHLTKIDAGTLSSVNASLMISKQHAKENAAANVSDGGTRETDPEALFANDYWKYSGKAAASQNANSRQEALNPEHIGSPSYRNSPQGVSDITAGREASKSNVNLAVQKNRLDAVDALIGQVRDMAGMKGSPERATFEASIGPIIQNSGKEFWNNKLPWNVDSKIPGVMHATRANVKFLQDELAQYIQTKGGSSDARARNAYDAIGELQNSTDAETFLYRLGNLQKVTGTLREVQPVQVQGVQSHVVQPGATAQGAATPPVTAVGPGGKRIMLQNGQWVPIQ